MNLKFLHEQVERSIEVLPPEPGKVERSLAIVVRAHSEALVSELAPLLKQQGFGDIRIEAKRSLFRKYWELIATTARLPFSASALHAWLDATHALVHSHGCTLEHWVPLAKSNEEL